MIRRFLPALVASMALSTGAMAADIKLCVIDAQGALNGTNDGKAAQANLESKFAAKQAEIEKIQKGLEKEFQDYEQRKMILSDSARGEQERGLLEKRQQFQAMVMQAEQEMQQTYAELLSSMEEKLMKAASALGAKSGCTVLMPKEATVYVAPTVTDLTQQLILDLNAKK